MHGGWLLYLPRLLINLAIGERSTFLVHWWLFFFGENQMLIGVGICSDTYEDIWQRTGTGLSRSRYDMAGAFSDGNTANLAGARGSATFWTAVVLDSWACTAGGFGDFGAEMDPEV